MATSSITHNFVISKPKQIKNFVNALNISSKNKVEKSLPESQKITSRNEILAFFSNKGANE